MFASCRLIRQPPRSGLLAYLLVALVLAASPVLYWNAFRGDSESAWSFWRYGPQRQPSSTPQPPPIPSSSSPPEPDLPSEYERTSDQEMCELMYGRGYFAHINRHQHPYCEPASSSSFLQCFSAPRLPHPWQSPWSSAAGDPICIARGVYLHAVKGDNKGPLFHAPCTARDFRREMQEGFVNPIDPDADLAGVPHLTGFQTYWGDSGVGAEFRASWDFGDGEGAADSKDQRGCTKDSNNGEWLLVVRREPQLNLWHKMMNLWQAMITVDALQVAVDRTTGRPWLSRADASRIRVVFDDDIGPDEDYLEDWWAMLNNGEQPVQARSLPPGTCFGNVIVPLAGPSSPFWAALAENVLHSPCQTSFLIDAFRRRVFQFLGIVPGAFEPREHPTITFVNRTHNRKLWDVDNLFAKVQKLYPDSALNVVDFADMSLREQVEMVAETDVFIGHHGAGMTHIFFLPPDAALVEITSHRSRKFRTITRMRGLAHFEADCLEQPAYENQTQGKELPPGWRPGMDDQHWQSREYAYFVEDDFLRWVDAAVRSQRNKLYS